MKLTRPIAGALLAGLFPISATAQLPHGTIFFCEGTSSQLSGGSVGFSGTDLHAFSTNETIRVLGMAIDRSRCHVYYGVSERITGVEYGSIIRINTNGTDRQTIVANRYPGPFPRGVTLDAVGQRLYWFTTSGTTRIWSCKLDGSDSRGLVAHNVLNPGISPTVMQVDSTTGKLYWFDQSYGGFRRCNLDGSQVENLLATGSAYSADIDVVNGSFYWAHFDTLYRAPISAISPPAVIATDPSIFLPKQGKLLDVEPSMDLITWVVSGGRIHFTSISNPGTITELPVFQGEQPSGSLEVMPGPRPGLAIAPSAVSAGTAANFDICGVLPSGPAVLILVDWNGASFYAPLFGVFTDPHGAATLPIPIPAGLANSSGHFSVVAFDSALKLVNTLPAPLTVF